MSLGRIPLNDMLAQCSKKLVHVSDEEREKRISEINECDHLFIKLRDYDNNMGNNDLSIVECVHCGVTNKYYDLERVLAKYKKSLDYYVLTNYHYTNVKYDDATIESLMMDRLIQSHTKLNMISDKTLHTYHPGVLYKVAKIINPQASNEELFEIMQQLAEIETFEEKTKLNNIYDATDLIERYKKNYSHVKIK